MKNHSKIIRIDNHQKSFEKRSTIHPEINQNRLTMCQKAMKNPSQNYQKSTQNRSLERPGGPPDLKERPGPTRDPPGTLLGPSWNALGDPPGPPGADLRPKCPSWAQVAPNHAKPTLASSGLKSAYFGHLELILEHLGDISRLASGPLTHTKPKPSKDRQV